jgi:ParB family chromosome partitioning protein
LPTSVQDRVERGELSFGHGRALLALEHAEEIEKAAQRIAERSLSVRQTESYIQGLIHPDRTGKQKEKPEPVVDPNVREVQERLQRVLGLKVNIEDRGGKGRVIIEYARLEDFDTLLEMIGGRAGE